MVKGFDKPTNSTATSGQSLPVQPALNCDKVQQQMLEHFENLSDPLRKQGVLHPFVSIVMIALLATIGGATGWEDIETYGISYQHWLSSFLALPNGIPSADTYRRVFEQISPSAFEGSFNSWLSSLVRDLGAQVIPIDGKQLKSSYDRNQSKSALHVVSAWASEHRLFRRSC
ncbi:MAG: ISAs1 family transposase [Moorea sp. SIO2I5]|nr:ISAs1 family transposase [Moorena sp. SIO2I5]